MGILADTETRVIIQGITGREAASATKDMLDYGTKVVAGVTPGKGGQRVHDVPVYDTVERAVSEHPAEASFLAVPPAMAKEAALEALENGIRLLVMATERIPRRDVVEVIEVARERGAWVIGPNSLGIITPHKVKIGMAGGPVEDVKKAYMPGPVGIASRSGGMTTEIANMLKQAGIGQSTCVSIGGDPIVGSNFLDLMPLFDQDPDTKVVVLFCEPGGVTEERLAEEKLGGKFSTPIVAFVAGRFADTMPGVRFGHAATIVEGTRGSTASKVRMFKKAGIPVAEKLSEIVPLVRESLQGG
jgi:succinyl-CoA synthetase alpha subunit